MQYTSSSGIGKLLSTVDLRTLVPRSYVTSTGVRFLQIRCVMHQDTKPSMAVYSDGAYCFVCGKGMSPEQFVKKVYGLDTLDAVTELVKNLHAFDTIASDPIEPELITPDQGLARSLHLNLTEQAVQYYLERGLDLSTIEQYQLGWGRINESGPEGYSIPIFVGDTLRQIKLRVPNVDSNKYRSIAKCGTWLYLADDAEFQDRVIITEGEFDALILRQMGYIAVTSTGGAGTFREHWKRSVEGSTLYCAYDDDKAGDDGWRKLELIFQRPLRRIRWGKRTKDATEAYLTNGGEYLINRINEANEAFITKHR